MLVKCDTCGELFNKAMSHINRSKHNFCSKGCFGEFCHKRVEVECSFCSEVYEVTPYRKQQTVHHFCSDECYRQWKSTRFKDGGNPNWQGKTIRISCEGCGKVFERQLYQTKQHNFCSQKCKNTYQKGKNLGADNPCWKPKIRKNCEWCCKTIERLNSQIGTHTFCSLSCAAKWRMQNIPYHRKTQPEQMFEDICNNNNLPFRYVGDGSFWIENLNPDFVECNGKKIAIEIFGDFWHSPLLRYNIGDYQRADIRENVLKKYGWKLIIFWESDLKRDDVDKFVLNQLAKERGIGIDKK